MHVSSINIEVVCFYIYIVSVEMKNGQHAFPQRYDAKTESVKYNGDQLWGTG